MRAVMVEAPIRSRMEEKSGREIPSTNSTATTPVLNNILAGPNSDIRICNFLNLHLAEFTWRNIEEFLEKL